MRLDAAQNITAGPPPPFTIGQSVVAQPRANFPSRGISRQPPYLRRKHALRLPSFPVDVGAVPAVEHRTFSETAIRSGDRSNTTPNIPLSSSSTGPQLSTHGSRERTMGITLTPSVASCSTPSVCQTSGFESRLQGSRTSFRINVLAHVPINSVSLPRTTHAHEGSTSIKLPVPEVESSPRIACRWADGCESHILPCVAALREHITTAHGTDMQNNRANRSVKYTCEWGVGTGDHEMTCKKSVSAEQMPKHILSRAHLGIPLEIQDQADLAWKIENPDARGGKKREKIKAEGIRANKKE
jgi:hypothetical protein